MDFSVLLFSLVLSSSTPDLTLSCSLLSYFRPFSLCGLSCHRNFPVWLWTRERVSPQIPKGLRDVDVDSSLRLNMLLSYRFPGCPIIHISAPSSDALPDGCL